MPVNLSLEEIAERKLLFQICKTKEELWGWIYYFLETSLGNLDIPDVIVDPDSNITMMDFIWKVYAHFTGTETIDNPKILLYAPRDGGKSLAVSVIEVLTLLHLDLNVVHLAAIEEQSANVQRYIKNFFGIPALRSWKRGDNIRSTNVVIYKPLVGDGPYITNKEFRTLEDSEKREYQQYINRVEVIVATMESANGKHAPILCVSGDTEIDVGKSTVLAVQIYDTIIKSGGATPILAINETNLNWQAWDIKDGPNVYSVNGSGQLELSQIIRVQKSLQDTWKLTTFGGRSISGTASHRIQGIAGEYKSLDQFKPGEWVSVIVNKQIVSETIQSIEYGGLHWVFDFTLDKNHNYVSNGYISHNCLDELDLLNPRVHAEARNIATPIRRRGKTILPLNIMVSTRKFTGALVQKEIDDAVKNRTAVYHYNLLDVSERCPDIKHRPDLPRLPIYRNSDSLEAIDVVRYQQLDFKQQSQFIEDEGYWGCLNNCQAFATCRGNLAKQTSTSEFLKPIEHVINQLTTQEPDMVKSQMMCWKPSATGLVYPFFDPAKHVITPARAYELVFGEPPVKKPFAKNDLYIALNARDVSWEGGVDFGTTHYYAWTSGFRDGANAFCTQVLAYPGLDPAQQVEVSQPIHDTFHPKIWPDMAYPGTIKMFKKAGFHFRTWKKGPGSVQDGIRIVQQKMKPGLRPPEFYIVIEEGGELMMSALVKQLGEYRWTLAPDGRPTDQPVKTDDDLCDSTRYWLMNSFAPKGKIVVEGQTQQVQPIAAPPDPYSTTLPVYTEKNWAAKVMAEQLGRPYEPPQQHSNRRMTISKPGSNFYGEENSSDEKPKGNGQRKGSRIVFDI